MTEILLAAFNGARYIREQLDSILRQTYTGWHLTAADDGSTDGTYEILCEYADRYPDKIAVIRNSPGTGSAKANFMSLIRGCDADVIAFSDQDDVWHEDKLKACVELESDSPCLIHTDAVVVNSDLTVKAPSFMRYQGLDPSADTLNRLLAQNNVTGCTMAMNRPLAELMKRADPDDMLMHDWWAALLAASFGKIVFLPDRTVSYRQHGDNTLGAVNNRTAKGIARIVSDTDGVKARLGATFAQAQAFLDTYGDMLPDDRRLIIEGYLAIPKMGKLSRMAHLLKGGYTKQNLMSGIGQMIYC
ncbi:MAG: glycosyltransferase family 2 protein [Oscillospiraceae bacterium]|nr:glycosyltransferase family 2 protein [Oscillospiraceae bacterium]